MSAGLRHRFVDALTHGRGSITAIGVLLPIDPDRARSVLPEGLRLLRKHGEQATVLLLLSTNHFSSWFGEMRYHELTFGIPDVVVTGGARGMYLRRLYLDQTLPQVLGNLVYGFEKLPAKISWDRGPERERFRVADRVGRAVLDAGFEPAGGQVGDRSGHDRMRAILDQPVFSQARRRWDPHAALTRGGPYLRTQIRYADTDFVTQPVRGRVRFGPAFDPVAFAELELEFDGLGAGGYGAAAWQTPLVVTLPRRA